MKKMPKGQRGSPVVKSQCCSCRGQEFGSQLPYQLARSRL